MFVHYKDKYIQAILRLSGLLIFGRNLVIFGYKPSGLFGFLRTSPKAQTLELVADFPNKL